jgi:integrase/recombinase XerD
MKEIKSSTDATVDKKQSFLNSRFIHDYSFSDPDNRDQKNQGEDEREEYPLFQGFTEAPSEILENEYVFNSYILDCKARKLSDGTISFYKKKIYKFFLFLKLFYVDNLEQITPNLIRGFLIHLQEHGHNAGGIDTFYRSIRTFLNWCEKEYELMNWKNPILKVKRPKVPEIILDPVKIDEVKKLINVCNKDTFQGFRNIAILIILLDTGVRASELLSIELDDIDFVENKILIRYGKGKKFRYVIFGYASKSILKKYLNLRSDKNRFLWVCQDGTNLSYSGVRSFIRRLSKKANIDPPALHDFRRCFAITMLRNDVNIFALQKLMGHSDSSMLKRYLKQLIQDIQIAHQKSGPVDGENLLKGLLSETSKE